MYEAQKKYRFNHPWVKHLGSARYRCSNQKSDNYHRYGGRGIKCLLSSEETQILWFRDKAHEMIKPSIDRVDNDGNYEFANCCFIELNKNCCKETSKSISQFSLTGKFIKSFSSIREASRRTGAQTDVISLCATGRYKQAGGYIWRFKYES